MPPADPAHPATAAETVVDGATSETLPAGPEGGAIGGTIGRYRVERALGHGGMGVVVAGFDPELGRKVAIKVLRDGKGSSGIGERLRREAQALARVTHPNVVAVYDAGVADSAYLVMQLIEGETLGAYLEKHHPAPAAIVALFVQAARGLAAIHAAGLIHRDFKPSNALVDGDGVVHVSDLGLARIGELAQGQAADATRDTAGADGTLMTNGIVGTPAYMSPEQATASELTPACDQFSLCVALWEALYGVRPFAGATVQEIQASIAAGELREPPGRGVPQRIESALRRGLQRDPAARFSSMTALIAALAPPSRTPWIAGGVGLVAIGGVTAAVLAMRGGASPAHAPATGLQVEGKTVSRLTQTEVCDEFPAFGPDGTIYYDAPVGRDYRLFAMNPATKQARMLTDVRGWDLAPQPSPDGKRLAFIRRTDEPMGVYIAPLDDLAHPRRVAGGGFRPAWSPDGRFVWAGARSGLARYDAATLVKDRALTLPKGAYPMMGVELPDGRFVLLTKTGGATADGLALFPSGSAEARWLIPASDDNPMEEVLTLTEDGEGVLVTRFTPTGTTELVRVPLDGTPPSVVVGGNVISARKRLAIHDRTLVWSDCAEHIGLSAMTRTADGVTRFDNLASNPWVDGAPIALPGTHELVFISYRTQTGEIWRIGRDGSSPRKVSFGTLEPDRLFLSHDGRTLAVVTSEGLSVGPLDGSSPPRLLLAADTEEQNASFSRDNRRIYVERLDDGKRRLAVIPVAGGDPTWVLPAPSFAPAQSPTHDTLAYLTIPDAGTAGSPTVPMLLDLATGATRRVAPSYPAYPFRDLRWSPDGKRLLAARRDGDIVEFDVATGAVLRSFDMGVDQLVGYTYLDDEIITGRVTWTGDLWSIALR